MTKWQGVINKTVDYLYKLVQDETGRQNQVMIWVLTFQSFVLAAIFGKGILSYSGYRDNLLCLLDLAGLGLSISAVYTLFVSEKSIGNILAEWDAFNKLGYKPKNWPHLVIATPKYLLDSWLSILSLHCFAPIIFLAVWITLPFLKFWPSINLYCCAFLFCGVVVCLLCIRKMLTMWCDKQANNHEIQKWRIYHIMIDRFYGWKSDIPNSVEGFAGGTIKGISKKLKYIKSQGYNTIMLTPHYCTNAYHGYHITDYKKVDEHFGTEKDFVNLIKKAHKKGIKVICDFVPNHCHKTNTLYKSHLQDNWFYKNAKGDIVHFMGIQELPKFNLKNAEVVDYMIEIAKSLVKKGIDGLRIDHAVGVPFEFLKKLRSELKKMNPNIFIIGEVWLPDQRAIEELSFINDARCDEFRMNGQEIQDKVQRDYEQVLDGVLDFAYRKILIGEVKNGVGFTNRPEFQKKVNDHFANYKMLKPILFLDNHDTERFMYFCDYDRSLLDEALAFTKRLQYPLSVYYGTELYMNHDKSVVNGGPNADLQARALMSWK